MHNKKRGLTLIEVVVALGVLTVVFSGTITLVVQVTRLAMLSRDKTTAASLAQKALAEEMSNTSFTCSPTITSGTFSHSYTLNGVAYDVPVTVDPASLSGATFSAPAAGDYVKFTANVLKGSETLYTLKQIVRKP